MRAQPGTRGLKLSTILYKSGKMITFAEKIDYGKDNQQNGVLLQELWGGVAQVGGPVSSLRLVEHIYRGAGGN